jgi:hypothetical protein
MVADHLVTRVSGITRGRPKGHNGQSLASIMGVEVHPDMREPAS